ncbi:NUDIX domain-containing protein [Vallitalea okinawensis]|uniref:NUDIX domain-containing protein n=1 Tax=Vallitalea okinawensis TaxID=2078660 RepID=UPI000CFAC712|nr:NUDIX hydrolase [Vallitalea okinawensis]
MYIVTNEWGYNLVRFIMLAEEDILENNNYTPLTGSLIVVKYKDKYMIGFNRYRKQWEIPGGAIEIGETARECVIRELEEETSQKIDEVEFIGLAKIFDNNKKKIKYQALFYKEIDKIAPFQENAEMKEIMLWNLKDDIGRFDEVDKYIMQFCVDTRKTGKMVSSQTSSNNTFAQGSGEGQKA